MSTASDFYDEQPLYLIKGERQDLALDMGANLTGVTLTLHVRAAGASSDAVQKALVNDDPAAPVTYATSATLTLSAGDKANLDPKLRYTYKVADGNNRVYRRGPAFALSEWP